MPVQTIEKEVNGHAVKIVQFHAVRGFKIKAKLFKLVLPVLSSVVNPKDLNSTKDIMNADINLVRAFETLATVINEESLFTLLLELLSGVFVDGINIDQKKFDELFIADYSFAYKLAYEVIKANNFFDFGDIGNLMKKFQMPVSPKS
jgi:hypothetical protein